MSDDEKKRDDVIGDRPVIPETAPIVEAVESDDGLYVRPHGPDCARAVEIRDAMNRGEEPPAPWDSPHGNWGPNGPRSKIEIRPHAGPALVNSKAYRDNYDSIFGKRLPKGEA